MLVKIRILLIFFLLLFIGLTLRLGYWQVVKGKDLSDQAKYQYKSNKILSARRGSILDANGDFLAGSREVWTVFAIPGEIKDSPAKIARILSPFIGVGEEEINGFLSDKNQTWVPIAKNVDTGVKKNIEALQIEGIGFEENEGRVYPEASVASQLIGFVGKNEGGDNVGYFGLEGFYDLALSPKMGFLGGERDGRGDPILTGTSRKSASADGVDLATSIDKRIQSVLYERLKEGIEKYGAKGGTAIVMNPKTGAVLGMESLPSFDPGKYWEFGDAYFKNPAVTDVFEPGSIFKVLVMAAGLDAGVVEPDTACEICGGPLKIDKYTIETWNKEYNSDATMTDVIVHSDNVGMSFVGQKLGAPLLYDYLSKFGIGSPTGIDLQGEASPKMREKNKWSDVDLATAAFGQGIAVTPIQMVRAVGAIANGGVVNSPRIVEKIINGGISENVLGSQGLRVIGKKAAEEITKMMAEAAKNGESKWTNLKGFKVAGKTGTAQIPIAGHYDEEKTNASFIGFAPFDDPKMVMLVILREPQTSQWASETAAPLWYSIAKDLFPYLGIRPED